nr:hypothetical protein [uncultured bacterium]
MFTSVDGMAGNLDNVTYRNRSGSGARTERRQPLRANPLQEIPAMQIPETITWKGKQYEVPDMETLGEFAFDSVCETPDGDTVEPDHPDSWLSILGLI